jgi:HD-GYP domain-containing protein (c-di-GMP phosphodiesterase class II)
VIFVCDAFDAMTSERAYATAMTAEAALAELRSNAGTQFDPVAVAALAAVLEERANGVPARAALLPMLQLLDAASA